MKVIKNPILPFKGFIAISFLGWIWTRRDELDPVTINHEKIHLAQERELWYIGFWTLYLLEFLYWLIIYFNGYKAYRAIRFEKEAYAYEKIEDYLKRRERFKWRVFRRPSF